MMAHWMKTKYNIKDFAQLKASKQSLLMMRFYSEHIRKGESFDLSTLPFTLIELQQLGLTVDDIKHFTADHIRAANMTHKHLVSLGMASNALDTFPNFTDADWKQLGAPDSVIAERFQSNTTPFITTTNKNKNSQAFTFTLPSLS